MFVANFGIINVEYISENVICNKCRSQIRLNLICSLNLQKKIGLGNMDVFSITIYVTISLHICQITSYNLLIAMN